MPIIIIHPPVNILKWFSIACCLCFMAGCYNSKKIISSPESKINTAERLKRNLKAGENHRYSIQLNAGEFLHIKIVQEGIDVIAKVTTADGQYAEQFDSPTGELNDEDIYLLSDENRKYQIEIYPAQKYADPGEYVIRTVRSDNASETDKKWMTALAATQKADKMRSKAETRQQSILQYESAMKEWLALKDTMQYARTMRSMGFVYIRLRNYDKAVEIFSQLIPIWKQLNDTRAEGFTYLIIGRVYDLQKDYKKSLEYNQQSMPPWAKVKDTDQESFTLMNIGNLHSYSGDKQKTDESFEQALKKNEQSERPSIKPVILRDYANSLMRLGEEAKAIQMYEQSLKQWQATVNQPEEARTTVLLADYFSKKERKEEAIRYYQHALTIWQKMDEQAEIKIIQEALDKIGK